MRKIYLITIASLVMLLCGCSTDPGVEVDQTDDLTRAISRSLKREYTNFCDQHGYRTIVNPSSDPEISKLRASTTISAVASWMYGTTENAADFAYAAFHGWRAWGSAATRVPYPDEAIGENPITMVRSTYDYFLHGDLMVAVLRDIVATYGVDILNNASDVNKWAYLFRHAPLELMISMPNYDQIAEANSTMDILLARGGQNFEVLSSLEYLMDLYSDRGQELLESEIEVLELALETLFNLDNPQQRELFVERFVSDFCYNSSLGSEVENMQRLIRSVGTACRAMDFWSEPDPQPEPEPEPGYVRLNRYSTEVNYNRNSASIYVSESNVEWVITIQSGITWVTSNVTGGEGGNTSIDLILSDNPNRASRTARIYVHEKGQPYTSVEPFILTQKGRVNYVEFTPQVIEAPKGGGNIQVSLVSDTNWSYKPLNILPPPDGRYHYWAFLNEKSGTGNTYLSIEVDPNYSGISRSQEFIFSTSQNGSAFTVVQPSAGAPQYNVSPKLIENLSILERPFYVDISGNQYWEVIGITGPYAHFIELSKTSGYGNERIVLTVKGSTGSQNQKTEVVVNFGFSDVRSLKYSDQRQVPVTVKFHKPPM